VKASNDLSMDPIETRALRYTLPLALFGTITALAFIAWLLTL
jgi:hypothetical protein